MQKTKLIQILKTFSNEEWKEFVKFAVSPYFNKGRNYLPLLKELKGFYPEFESVKLKKENIYLKLFPGKEYKANVMKTIISGLNSLAENYLAQKMFDHNKFEVLLAKLNAFHNRNLEKRFSDSMLYAYEHFQDLEIVDPLDALRNKYELSLIEATFYNGRRDLNIKNKRFDVTTSVATLFFMEYFVTYADEVAKSNAINQPLPEIIDIVHHNVNLDNIIPHLAESNPSEKYKILFYYGLYMARRKKDIKYYFEAKKIFFDNLEKIPKPTKQSFIFLMMNILIYIWRVNEDIILLKERFEMIKFMFDNELHIFHGDEILPLGSFKNALYLSIDFNDLAFTEILLEKHVNFIHKSLVDPYRKYGYALLAFKKKEFGNSLGLLQKIDLDEPELKMDVKVLSSKLFYELSYWENAYSFSGTFKKFLSENMNVSASLRERMLRYVKHYYEILKLRTGAKSESADHIRRNIKKEHLNDGYNWLLEKLDEIEKQ